MQLKDRASSIGKYIKAKYIWLAFCAVFLVVSIAGGVSSSEANSRIKQVDDGIKHDKETFKANKEAELENTPLEPEDELPGIVLLNVGEKSTSNVKADDIHNIIVISFTKNNKVRRMNLTAVQKETCVGLGKKDSLKTIKQTFDRKNPKKMYQAIEKGLDYKVGAYIAYNNDTIKNIVDILYLVYVNIDKIEYKGVDDIPRINEQQKKYAKEYTDIKEKPITKLGLQTINALQAVAYANMYSEIWDCVDNDWRHLYLIHSMIEGMRGSNYEELERMRGTLLSGDYDISDSHLIAAATAMKVSNKRTFFRWPYSEEVQKHNGVNYVFPTDLAKGNIHIHKIVHEERNYKPSATEKKYAKELKKIRNYMIAFKEEQAAKEAAREEQERLASEDSDSSSDLTDNDGTSSKKDDNKSTAKKNTKKKTTSSTKKKDKSSSSSSGKSGSSSSSGSGGSSSGGSGSGGSGGSESGGSGSGGSGGSGSGGSGDSGSGGSGGSESGGSGGSGGSDGESGDTDNTGE